MTTEPNTTAPTTNNQKYIWMIVIGLIILILLALLGIVFLIMAQNKPVANSNTTVATNTPLITPTINVITTAACDSTIGETYESEKFALKFNYPCSFGRVSESVYPKSDCTGETQNAIIAFSGNLKFNIDVNECDQKEVTAKITQEYDLVSKDGTKFSVIIFADAFTPDLSHITVTSDGRIQLRGGSIKNSEVEQFKKDLAFVILSMEID